MYLLRVARGALLAGIFVPLFSAALHPGIRNLVAWNSAIKQQSPYNQFLRLLVRLTVNFFVPEYALFHRLCILIVFCDSDTQENARNHTRVRAFPTEVSLCTVFGIAFQNNCGL